MRTAPVAQLRRRVLLGVLIVTAMTFAVPPFRAAGADGVDREQWRIPEWWFEPGADAQTPDAVEEPWMQDPFGHISGDMKSASDDLHAAETRPPVEVTHPRLEERLAALVEMLEKQCKAGGAGAGAGNPSRPATASTLRTGKGREGPLTDPGDSKRKWAQLSPKQREKIEQARTEGFPPGYEDVLADYFLRLSREDAADKPVDKPANK